MKVRCQKPEHILVYEIEGDIDVNHPELLGIWKEGEYSFLFFRYDRPDSLTVSIPNPKNRHVFKYDDWVGGSLKTTRIGAFTIRPAWEISTPEEEGNVIIIDPNVVFGSGLHPTTQQCLLLIGEIEEPINNAYDLGTGTGILALALARKGARVIAVDNNPLCVEVARRNVSFNGFDDRIEVICEDLCKLEFNRGDILVANIGYEIINFLLNKITTDDFKTLIISGITRSYAHKIESLLEQKGFVVKSHMDDGTWHSFLAKRR